MKRELFFNEEELNVIKQAIEIAIEDQANRLLDGIGPEESNEIQMAIGRFEQIKEIIEEELK